jgi:hypothetical protein
MRLDVIVIYVDVQLICSSNNVYCSNSSILKMRCVLKIFYFTSSSCHTEGTRRRASNYKYLLTNDTKLRCYSTAENFGHLAGLYAESHNESLGVHHRKTQELDSQTRETKKINTCNYPDSNRGPIVSQQ